MENFIKRYFLKNIMESISIYPYSYDVGQIINITNNISQNNNGLINRLTEAATYSNLNEDEFICAYYQTKYLVVFQKCFLFQILYLGKLGVFDDIELNDTFLKDKINWSNPDNDWNISSINDGDLSYCGQMSMIEKLLKLSGWEMYNFEIEEGEEIYNVIYAEVPELMPFIESSNYKDDFKILMEDFYGSYTQVYVFTYDREYPCDLLMELFYSFINGYTTIVINEIQTIICFGYAIFDYEGLYYEIGAESFDLSILLLLYYYSLIIEFPRIELLQ